MALAIPGLLHFHKKLKLVLSFPEKRLSFKILNVINCINSVDQFGKNCHINNTKPFNAWPQ